MTRGPLRSSGSSRVQSDRGRVPVLTGRLKSKLKRGSRLQSITSFDSDPQLTGTGTKGCLRGQGSGDPKRPRPQDGDGEGIHREGQSSSQTPQGPWGRRTVLRSLHSTLVQRGINKLSGEEVLSDPESLLRTTRLRGTL